MIIGMTKNIFLCSIQYQKLKSSNKKANKFLPIVIKLKLVRLQSHSDCADAKECFLYKIYSMIMPKRSNWKKIN